MAPPVKKHTKEHLTKLGLTDTSERAIALKIYVKVTCRGCGKEEDVKFSTALATWTATGLSRQCSECRHKDARRGGPVYAKVQASNNDRYGAHYSSTREYKEKVKQTNIERYGVASYSKTEEWAARKKKTTMERHGYEHWLQNPTNHEQIQKTMFDRYGVSHYTQTVAWIEQIKKTCLERYGAEFFTQTEEYVSKCLKTVMEKYGVPFYTQSQDYENKSKATCLEKYGSEYFSGTPDWYVKTTTALMVKYGVKSFFKSEEFAILKSANNWSTSKAELEIRAALAEMGIESAKGMVGGCEVDLLAGKIGIEHNGLYWHSEVHKKPSFHAQKQKICAMHDVQLVQVFEHEWRLRRPQVLAKLKAIFGVNEQSVGARKCQLVEVTQKVAKKFCEDNHIQGPGRGKLCVALVRDGEILCIGVFGLHTRQSGKMALNRFCSAPGVHVAGGLSRITQYAWEKLGRADIYSWCDLRWSNGNGYEKAGWIKQARNAPGYFYWPGGMKTISKQSRQKNIAETPSGISEHEHALADGLLRVYDAGKIRFIYKGPKR